MAFLINRSNSAKIDCLHSIVRYLYKKYPNGNTFSMNDAKYDPDNFNVHSCCVLLKESSLGYKYCPFLDNPMDDAGCLMTHQVKGDSTKSKQVSNTINSLHALGLVDRDGRKNSLSKLGIRFAQANYGTAEYQSILRKAVLCYGPCIGILKQINDIVDENNTFKSGDIIVGYPVTSENVEYKGNIVTISSGSQRDSNTRTRSCLLTWLTAAGFIRPISLKSLSNGEYAHAAYRDYINEAHTGNITFVRVESPSLFDDNEFEVSRPLNYKNLTKQIGALREKGMELVREATLQNQSKLINRRLAIVYSLNEAYHLKKSVSLKKLARVMEKNQDIFLVANDFDNVLYNELSIADMVGIPFTISEDGEFIKPLTSVNKKELLLDVPENVIDKLDAIL